MIRELTSHEVAGERRPRRESIRSTEMRAVIAAVLFENPRDLDVRELWTCGNTSYFRVNRWADLGAFGPHISRSVFLAVTREADGYRVREHQPRAAA